MVSKHYAGDFNQKLQLFNISLHFNKLCDKLNEAQQRDIDPFLSAL